MISVDAICEFISHPSGIALAVSAGLGLVWSGERLSDLVSWLCRSDLDCILLAVLAVLIIVGGLDLWGFVSIIAAGTDQ